MPEARDRGRGEQLAGHQPREQEVGGGCHAEGAAPRKPQQLGRSETAEPEHRSGMRRYAAPEHLPAKSLEGREEWREGVAGRNATDEDQAGSPLNGKLFQGSPGAVGGHRGAGASASS